MAEFRPMEESKSFEEIINEPGRIDISTPEGEAQLVEDLKNVFGDDLPDVFIEGVIFGLEEEAAGR